MFEMTNQIKVGGLYIYRSCWMLITNQ